MGVNSCLINLIIFVFSLFAFLHLKAILSLRLAGCFDTRLSFDDILFLDVDSISVDFRASAHCRMEDQHLQE